MHISSIRSAEDDPAAGLFITFAGMLLAVGMLMVYSSSFTSIPSEEEQSFLTRQMIFLLVAGMAGIAASRLPSTFWKQSAPVLYCGTILLLILVLIPGIGHSVNGARRWLRLGAMSVQPSETAKLTLPMLLCTLQYHFLPSRRWTLQNLVMYAIVALAPVLLILIEPDLGTSVFVGLTAVIAVWLGGLPLRYLFLVGAATAPLPFILLTLRPYQLARLRGFVDTWTNPDTAPYQIQQSLTTLGVGGLGGMGLGQGWQKLSFLPEANTDFVMAVVGEELGLVGTLGVVLLWCGIYYFGWKLIRRVPRNSFERTLAMTLLSGLVIQAAVNMAVVTALLPPKGISHPFISYGGSNLGLSILSLGVTISLTRLPNSSPISENI